MGDRVSIQFQDKDGDSSICLFHHWGGKWFPHFAGAWYMLHKEKVDTTKGTPLSRFEARNVMVQFIQSLSRYNSMRGIKGFSGDYDNPKIDYYDSVISHSIYTGATPDDGDNSDNGHYTIRTDTGDLSNQDGEIITICNPAIMKEVEAMTKKTNREEVMEVLKQCAN